MKINFFYLLTVLAFVATSCTKNLDKDSDLNSTPVVTSDSSIAPQDSVSKLLKQ